MREWNRVKIPGHRSAMRKETFFERLQRTEDVLDPLTLYQDSPEPVLHVRKAKIK